MATPVAVDFSETTTGRPDEQANTPVILTMHDEKENDAITWAQSKHKRAFIVGCFVLVGMIVGCSIGFTAGPNHGSTPSTSNELASESQEETQPAAEKSIPATEPPRTDTPSVPQVGAFIGTTKPPPTTTLATTTPPPTTTLAPKLTYSDTKFDWLNIDSWQGDNDISASFARNGFKSDRIVVSTFDRPFSQSPVLRTKQGWPGEKVILLEWIVYPGSDTNIWMLPTSLTSQFGDPRWPNCGEYDIFEMFNGDAAIGHTGTVNQFFGNDLVSFGQSTMHMASLNCFAPYYVKYPNLGPQAAQWKVEFNTKITMAVVFGTDSNGQYIQQIRDPKLTYGRDDTIDISATGGTASEKIYNNQQLYWGVSPTGACAAGHNPATGYPYWNPFRIVLQEQYLGKFEVTNLKVYTKTV